MAGLRRVLPGERVDRRAVGWLTAGHLGADLFLGTVPALVPFFVHQRGYSYAEAGFLVLAGSVASSLLQPVAGLVGDRLRAPWLVPLGLVLAGGGLAAATLLHAPAATAAALLVGGLGVAVFHPEAIRAMRAAAGESTGAALGVFAVGGNMGFALGPALAAPLAAGFGLPAAGAVGLLPLAAALLLLRGRRAGEEPAVDLVRPGARGPGDWRTFSLAACAATFGAAVTFGMIAFLPSWFADDLGSSVRLGSAAVAAMLVAGAVGTYAGGRLADVHGRFAVIVASLGALAALIGGLPVLPLALALPLLVAAGLALDASFYPLVATAQDALPARPGFASGVVLGLSVGVGAGFTTLLGALADAYGPRAAIWGCAGLAAAGLACALAMPRASLRAPAPAPTPAGSGAA